MKKLLLTALLSISAISFAPAFKLAVKGNVPTQGHVVANPQTHAQTAQVHDIVAQVLANIQKGGLVAPRADRLTKLNASVATLISSLQNIAPQDLQESAKESILAAYDALNKEADDLFELYKDTAFANFFTKCQNTTCKDLVKLQQTIAEQKERISGYSVWNNMVKKPISGLLTKANKNWTNRVIAAAIAVLAIKATPATVSYAYYNSGYLGTLLKWCITPGAVYTPTAKATAPQVATQAVKPESAGLFARLIA